MFIFHTKGSDLKPQFSDDSVNILNVVYQNSYFKISNIVKQYSDRLIFFFVQINNIHKNYFFF